MSGVTLRRQLILDTVKDLAADFLNDDRKEDEELPRGAIEAAIAQGEITQDEIVASFRAALDVQCEIGEIEEIEEHDLIEEGRC